MNKIVWGFSGEDAKMEDVLAHIPKGWHALAEELIKDLFALGWDGTLLQTKEKFGGFRFYINNGNRAILDRIAEAQDKSYTICEVTGKPGKPRTDLVWIRTLCDEEYDKLRHKQSEEIEDA